MGWVFTDAWLLDLGQARPPFQSFERYPDGTKVNAMGRHERGGVLTIEAFLDDREGMLVTVRKRSSQLRPAWMFRQALDLPVDELVRAHDEGSTGCVSRESFPPRRSQGGARRRTVRKPDAARRHHEAVVPVGAASDRGPA
jgi:hypothetical protein